MSASAGFEFAATERPFGLAATERNNDFGTTERSLGFAATKAHHLYLLQGNNNNQSIYTRVIHRKLHSPRKVAPNGLQPLVASPFRKRCI